MMPCDCLFLLARLSSGWLASVTCDGHRTEYILQLQYVPSRKSAPTTINHFAHTDGADGTVVGGDGCHRCCNGDRLLSTFHHLKPPNGRPHITSHNVTYSGRRRGMALRFSAKLEERRSTIHQSWWCVVPGQALHSVVGEMS